LVHGVWLALSGSNAGACLLILVCSVFSP